MSFLSIGYALEQGDSSIQQDRIRTSSTRVVLCDGHGPFGHEFAEAVCNFQITSETTDPILLFAETDTHLKEIVRPEKFSTVNGTTCTHVSFDTITRVMTVANLGDSALRYWDSHGEGVGVSTDHCPLNLSEFDRITAAGGRCTFHDNTNKYHKGKQSVFVDGEYNTNGAYYHKNCRKEHASYLENQPPILVDEEDDLYGNGPIAVDPKTKQPYLPLRLAVTRAFGDWPLVPYGVSCVPSVRTVEPPAEGVRAVVVASDGLWDVMKDFEIGLIVRNPKYMKDRDANGAAKEIVQLALLAGRKLFGPNGDNIAVAVVYL